MYVTPDLMCVLYEGWIDILSVRWRHWRWYRGVADGHCDAYCNRDDEDVADDVGGNDDKVDDKDVYDSDSDGEDDDSDGDSIGDDDDDDCDHGNYD